MSERRRARIAAGLVLITGGVALIQRGIADAYLVLGATWAAAAVVYLLAACVAPRRGLDDVDELAVASFVLPSVGAALLLPLTLQAIVFAGLGSSAREFDDWARVGLAMTAVAHVICGALVGIRAARLARGRPPLATRAIYFWTVAAGCIPGGLFVLPPFLVAITGVPIVLLISGMEPWIVNERFAASEAALPRAVAVS